MKKKSTTHDKKKAEPEKNYRIFRVERDDKTGKEKRITMLKFFAPDDKTAYRSLKEYRKVANRKYTYYYGRVTDNEHFIKDSEGNLIEFDSLEKMLDFCKKPHWWDVFGRIWMWLKCLPYRLRHAWQRMNLGHSEMEACELFSHILDDLEYNLPIIAENCQNPTMIFCAEARAEIHKNDKNFDLKSSLSKNPIFDENEISLASEIMKKMILGLLEDIRIYRLLSYGGIIDKSNPSDVEAYEKYSKILPYVQGKYKELDYDKLHSLTSKYRNRTFSALNRYAESMWF